MKFITCNYVGKEDINKQSLLKLIKDVNKKS